MKYRDLEIVTDYDGELAFGDPALREAWDEKWMRPLNRAATDKNGDKFAKWRLKGAYKAERASIEQKFMDRHGLKRSKAGVCFGRVIVSPNHRCSGAHCDGWECRYSSYNLFRSESVEWGHWFDHFDIFYNSSEKFYVITAQPYALHLNAFQEMEKMFASVGVEIDISHADAWHYPGWTQLVAFFGPRAIKKQG